jgi:c-di-GMP-binding flagellar brake protein YcgR
MKILRQKPIEGGFFYGCQFYDVSPTDEENVRQFVYKMQLLQNKLNSVKK